MSADAMHRVALVTAFEARALDEDLPPLVDALRQAGIDVHVTPWDAPLDWSGFDMLLLRSTWDYMSRLGEFLGWAGQVSQRSTLVNPLSVVRWNIDKHYLATLAAAGVPVVPTTFVEPGESASKALARFLDSDACTEFVIKPAIGAGSRDAQRHGRESGDAAVAHAERLLAADRSILLQPYLDRVDAEGEAALIFFGAEFSHSIRKGALLRPGEGSTTALFATETITARAVLDDELAVARRALEALPFTAPLYARVDLIRDAAGAPLLLELELIEPSLFFAYAPGAAARFARCISRSLSGDPLPVYSPT